MNPCTCHPSDNPPVPCAEKYALSECIRESLGAGSGYIPEAVLEKARRLIAAEVGPEYRYMYMSGKSDQSGAVQAVAKAILLWTNRVKAIAEDYVPDREKYSANALQEMRDALMALVEEGA